MPRKAKEKIEELNNLNQGVIEEVSSSKAKTTEKKTTSKDVKSKKTANTTTKKEVSTKSKVAKKEKSSKSTKAKATKSSTEKNVKTSKNSAKVKSDAEKKVSKLAKTSTKSKVAPTIVEYYDLPFRYNQTVVKILAQTPNILFIYWDISDDDRNAYVAKYGPDFFENTRPYLIITNETMHYTFEVEINDFANSWYLHVNDPDCQYKVELGRKFIVSSDNRNNLEVNDLSNDMKHFTSYAVNDYLYITSSNKMEMPNNHILFDRLGKSVFFRNVKTNIMSEKDISSISFLQKIGKVYNIYDLYKEIYKDELISDEFELNLPSSNSSSSFK